MFPDFYSLILWANHNNYIGLSFFIVSVFALLFKNKKSFSILFLVSFLCSRWIRYPTFSLLLNLDLIVPILFMGTSFLFYRFQSFFKKTFYISGLATLIIYFTPLARIGLAQLEQKIPSPQSIDKFEGFILLGGNFSLQQNQQSEPDHLPIIYNSAAPRLFEFIALAKKYSDKKILFTGSPLEARLTKRVFLDHGLDVKRLILENDSKNTQDNAKNTYQIIGASKGSWILVTSAFHMPRSLGLFQHKKINVIPFPLDFHTRPYSWKKPLLFMDRQNSIAWFTWTKEWAGMIDQFLMGLSPKLYPSL